MQAQRKAALAGFLLGCRVETTVSTVGLVSGADKGLVKSRYRYL